MQIWTVLMVAVVVLGAAGSGIAQIPQTISYQGVLTDGAGTPVSDGSYGIMFNIYTVASGGSDIWSEIKTVQVTGGIFSVVLGDQSPLVIAFDEQYWLGISVDGGNQLTPRRPFTASAYALNSRTVADSAVTSEKIAAGTVLRSLNALTGDVILAEGNNVTIATSGDSLIISATGGGASLDWSLTGNAGTTPGTDFLGTTDDVALEFHVNAARALRLEPHVIGPNIIAGAGNNSVVAGTYGAVIGGGFDHAISGNGSVIAGGIGNDISGSVSAIGGGDNNLASGGNSTIAGGNSNVASGQSSVIGGGDENVSSSDKSTVAGGHMNVASGAHSAIGGGIGNDASGYAATVPGGESNVAQGGHSLAAGRNAMALHGGSFVWADSSENTDFVTTVPDQFIIRAAGGVGIGTNTPQQELDVAGSVRMEGFALPVNPGAGYVLTSDATGDGSWQPFASAAAWGLAGNAGTTPGTDFVGTTDDVALEFHVNAARALRLEPDATSPNIIAGHSLNSVYTLAFGGVIGGGGNATTENTVLDNYGVVGGGAANSAGGNSPNPADAAFATVGGGFGNSAGGEYATVAGGNGSQADGVSSVVGGGENNEAIGDYAVVAGGQGNTIDGTGAVISGGSGNYAPGDYATIGGGAENDALEDYVTIGGGRANIASLFYSTVGGGEQNTANADHATVGGGQTNAVSGAHGTVGGGEVNTATSSWATVGGGWSNHASGSYGTIAGGQDNFAENRAVVAGGQSNRAAGFFSTVAGGWNNRANGYGATIMGGRDCDAYGDWSIAAGYRAVVAAAHSGAIVLADSSDHDFNSTAADEFAVRSTGGVRLVTGIDGAGAPTAGATLAAGSGTWGSLSDRNAKANFEPVDGAEILERVAALEITTWNYKAQDESVRHMGPIAQDFHAAFGLGGTDTRITTVDADGVSLAAIQALNEKLNRKLVEKDAQIADLEKRIARLEAMVMQVSQSK